MNRMGRIKKLWLLLRVGLIVGPGGSCWQDSEIGRRNFLSYILFYTDSNSAKQGRRANTRSQSSGPFETWLRWERSTKKNVLASVNGGGELD
jgi:hypothetical protein